MADRLDLGGDRNRIRSSTTKFGSVLVANQNQDRYGELSGGMRGSFTRKQGDLVKVLKS
jgi:hypothetical protein